MNWKKFGVYSLLFLLTFQLAMSFIVAAEALKVTGESRTIWTEKFGAPIGNILSYIFGPIPTFSQGVNVVSAMIITIAVCALIAITFGDIISTFSTFSTWISWLSAALIAIITINLGFATKTIAVMTGVFAILGTAAVFAGLAGAFVAFLIINLGLWRFRAWIIKRRAMMAADDAIAGGMKVSGGIGALGTITRAFEKEGKKK